MRRRATIPLGIDIGNARVRVALCERGSDGATRLIAVAARPTLDDPHGALADAYAELGTRERRCVLGMRSPDTLLRVAAFPAMRARERERAARYEAARFAPFAIDDAVVRVVPREDGRCTIGVARRDVLEATVGVAKRAKLRPVAVDDAAFALPRAFPHADALIDVGDDATLVIVPSEPVPWTRRFPIGGHAMTAAVVASLGIDEAAAEQRKRSVGLSGAGEYALEALVDHVAGALIETRASASAELRAVALCGNGARLSGFAGALERAVGIPVRLAALPANVSDDLPADVVRAASPDWGLAYGLALWERAG